MKQLLLLLWLVPTWLSAQEDQRYLAGAVPEVDGKVVFAKAFDAPSLTRDQLYDTMLLWAEGYFEKETERIAYTNKEKGEIAVAGNTYLVFSSTALSLDRARMNYQMTIFCEDGSCTMKMGAIRYTYDVSYQRDPEKYTAEAYITDKVALSKKGNLIRGMGKFRKATIDYANATMDHAIAAINQQYAVAPAAVTTPAIQPAASSAIPATPLQPAMRVMDGYVTINPNKIPGTIVQMLPNNDLVVTPTAAPGTRETTAVWKGIGTLLGKQLASVSVSTDSPVYKSIGNNETYQIAFVRKDSADKEVWMIMECRKQGETPDGEQITLLGEITNIWMK